MKLDYDILATDKDGNRRARAAAAFHTAQAGAPRLDAAVQSAGCGGGGTCGTPESQCAPVRVLELQARGYPLLDAPPPSGRAGGGEAPRRLLVCQHRSVCAESWRRGVRGVC
jgi:hypothetical protein